MRYTTEYQPSISRELKRFISENIEPTFSFDTNSTQMYGLELVIETLKVEIAENKLNVSAEDLKELNTILLEDVTYIEF